MNTPPHRRSPARALVPALALSAVLAATSCASYTVEPSPAGPPATRSTSPSTSPSSTAPRTSTPPSGPTDRPEPSRTVRPSSPAAVGIGVYNGHVSSADDDTFRQFGAFPDVASSYYQPHEPIHLAFETERIRRGIVPNLTITTKGTQLIAALAEGRSHPDFDAATAWLDAYVDALAALADVDPDVPVYATIDHEFKVKVRTGMITGPSADITAYAKALDRFTRRAHAAHPNIRVTYWMVGYDRLVEGTIGQKLRTRPDAFLVDPYAYFPEDTVTSIATEDVEWIRRQPWYDGQEIAIGELGMPVRLGDEAMARFYSDVRAQLARLGVSWAVLFNRERVFDTRIAERTDGRSFPAAVSAVREILHKRDR